MRSQMTRAEIREAVRAVLADFGDLAVDVPQPLRLPAAVRERDANWTMPRFPCRSDALRDLAIASVQARWDATD